MKNQQFLMRRSNSCGCRESAIGAWGGLCLYLFWLWSAHSLHSDYSPLLLTSIGWGVASMVVAGMTGKIFGMFRKTAK